MLFTVHTLVGAAVAKATGNPYAGFLAGFLSHHIIDALPHFDQGSLHTPRGRALYLNNEKTADDTLENFGSEDWLMLILDWLASLIFFGIIFFYGAGISWPLIIIGAFGGILPDLIGSSPLWSEKLEKKSELAKKYKNFHLTFHWTVPPKDWVVGMGIQMTLIASSFLYLMLK